jgi:hypothetical protein
MDRRMADALDRWLTTPPEEAEPDHTPEPEVGSAWDADGSWRPTYQQADPTTYGVVFPLAAECRGCGGHITRASADDDWEEAPGD